MRQRFPGLFTLVVALGSLRSSLLPSFWLAALVVVAAPLCLVWLFFLKVNFQDEIFL